MEKLNKEIDYLNRDIEKTSIVIHKEIIPTSSLMTSSLNVPIVHSTMTAMSTTIPTSVAQVPDATEKTESSINAGLSRKRIHLDGPTGESMAPKQTQTSLIPKDLMLFQDKQLERISPHMNDIVDNYFRAKDAKQEDDDHLFSENLMESCRYDRFKTLASIHFADHFLNHSSSIVSSIEFDKDDEYFATAGVTKKIKLFQFESIIATSSSSNFNSSITKTSTAAEKERRTVAAQITDDEEDENADQSVSLTPKYPIKEMTSASKIRYE